MRFIGDLHGAWAIHDVLTAMDVCKESIQVGDFGLGFGEDSDCRDLKHRFIRGNHDDKKICRNYPNWIMDGEIEETKFGPMMFIGGAYSVDVAYRTPGIDWWFDEELSQEDFDELIGLYEEIKPAIMVTHDCPDGIAKEMFNYSVNNFTPSITNSALRRMLNRHAPKLWIFGHHHQDVTKDIGDTKFICLGINSYIDIDLEGNANDTSEETK